ncbi:MAG: hypothetical protein COW30_01005 [Rhodospirillales bacterium CG15_BIG_FIL_POST_REV_8_21_14_020_66_15]|nr:MAG: hypothetical protein COW30_01005 [Rhodospirillales bacterium CG15_BIG_FIL_POST_REV_8_21_14_020_66_15]
MAEVRATLARGFRIGDAVYTTVVLKEATAGDVLDAEIAAERVYATAAGPVVHSSPAVAAFELLARQVDRLIGEGGEEFEGAVTAKMLRALPRLDLDLLMAESRTLENAAEREVLSERGRE